MSAALEPRPPVTIAEFLDWERHQSIRYEWDGVRPVAMVGGSFAHMEIASRLNDVLRPALRGGPRTVVRTGLKALTERGSRARYPDLVVTCAPIRPGDSAMPEPLLVVEVLSETTAAADRGAKRAEYAALPSVARYVMLAQEEALALICDRPGGFEECAECSTCRNSACPCRWRRFTKAWSDAQAPWRAREEYDACPETASRPRRCGSPAGAFWAPSSHSRRPVPSRGRFRTARSA